MSNEIDKSELDASDPNELNFEDDPSLQNDPEFITWIDRENQAAQKEIIELGAPF